jgi:hypothetical protein
MPTKRVPITRRHRASSEARAWECKFQTGYDFFGDLERLGLNEADAERAWRRFGARFMRDHNDPREPWALREFGEP